jgi:hypothetical protein
VKLDAASIRLLEGAYKPREVSGAQLEPIIFRWKRLGGLPSLEKAGEHGCFAKKGRL